MSTSKIIKFIRILSSLVHLGIIFLCIDALFAYDNKKHQIKTYQFYRSIQVDDFEKDDDLCKENRGFIENEKSDFTDTGNDDPDEEYDY